MANYNFDKPISELYKDFLNDVFEEVYRESLPFYESLNQSEKEKVLNYLINKQYWTDYDENSCNIKAPSGVSTKNESLDSFSEASFSIFLSKEYSNAVENEYEEIIDNKYKKEIMKTLFHQNIDNLKDKIKNTILDLEYYRFKDILGRI